MALGIALGTAAIAGDEETGHARIHALAPRDSDDDRAGAASPPPSRFCSWYRHVSALSLIVSIPLFELGDSVTTTATRRHHRSTAPGRDRRQTSLAGTFAAFAVGRGDLRRHVPARRGSTGPEERDDGCRHSGLAIAGYVFYTLSQMTSSLEFLTWVSAVALVHRRRDAHQRPRLGRPVAVRPRPRRPPCRLATLPATGPREPLTGWPPVGH